MPTLGSPLDIARGLIPGSEPVIAYGKLVTGGAVTNHLIWPVSGTPDLAVPSASGVQMTIASTSVNDTAAGTGIRTVEMHYLDINLAPKSEIITLNGTTGVTTVATDIRFIQCFHMLTYGTGRVAAGEITAKNGGTTYSIIKTGERRCASSARMVPAGKRLILSSAFSGSSSPTSAATSEINFVGTNIYNNDLTADGITFPFMGIANQDGSEALSGVNVPAPAGSVVAMEVTTDKAATIIAGYVGWFEDAVGY